MKKTISLVMMFCILFLIEISLGSCNKGNDMNRQSIQKVFDARTKSNSIHEAILLVENSKGDFSESFGYGGRTIDTPIQAASIGKLFTTACILILEEQKKYLLTI